LLAESEKQTNFRSPEEAIEHAVKQLAVSLVLKDARVENLVRLKLIDAYISGKYFQQAKDHCVVLLSTTRDARNSRWRAEIALREAKILLREISDQHLTVAVDRLQIYADFFGLDDSWCRVALEISDRMSPAGDRDALLQRVADVAADADLTVRALERLAGLAIDPETRRRANEQLLELQPSTDAALKVSLACVQSGNFGQAMRVLERFQGTDERISLAISALKLKI
jgi:hypothetical protein